jgi:hypothetical protein
MLQSLITGFLGGVGAWFLTDYVAKPLRRFYDLRREVSRCLVVFGNVGARSAIDQSGARKKLELSADEDARLVDAQNTFRGLAGDMRAFANVDFLANWLVTRLGYDADKIASALIALEGELPTKGKPRADARERVQKLLHIRS